MLLDPRSGCTSGDRLRNQTVFTLSSCATGKYFNSSCASESRVVQRDAWLRNRAGWVSGRKAYTNISFLAMFVIKKEVWPLFSMLSNVKSSHSIKKQFRSHGINIPTLYSLDVGQGNYSRYLACEKYSLLYTRSIFSSQSSLASTIKNYLVTMIVSFL